MYTIPAVDSVVIEMETIITLLPSIDLNGMNTIDYRVDDIEQRVVSLADQFVTERRTLYAAFYELSRALQRHTLSLILPKQQKVM